MTIEAVLKKVTSFNLPKNSFIVFGSGPLAALDIRDVEDIDLLVTAELFEKLKKAGWKQINTGESGHPIMKGKVTAHDSWSLGPYCPTLPELLSRAFEVERVPFASLEDVRKWKVASGRPTDLPDIKLIDEYLMGQIAFPWIMYLAKQSDWRLLLKGVKPRTSGSGLVYELPNYLDRPNESFAITDMSRIELSDPHLHTNGEIEVYIALQGSGKIAVGDSIKHIEAGGADAIVGVPPDTLHMVRPDKDLVVAIIQTPPHDPNNTISMSPDDPTIAATIAKLQQATTAI